MVLVQDHRTKCNANSWSHQKLALKLRHNACWDHHCLGVKAKAHRQSQKCSGGEQSERYHRDVGCPGPSCLQPLVAASVKEERTVYTRTALCSRSPSKHEIRNAHERRGPTHDRSARHDPERTGERSRPRCQCHRSCSTEKATTNGTKLGRCRGENTASRYRLHHATIA